MSSWLWKGNITFITAPFTCKEWKVDPAARAHATMFGADR
jgi:hypothetical protein